ncbi:MAG: hypothetical protein AVDCRST_MAG02-3913 [uncultured Rubrobacteraceae bacterium]|uniref:Uncharacterized protein n=1 Tax=uncultured Rubrobacteraceae bacterium TaxID=349277 RepID=A0A6J4RHT3_9ACTN|nr:MAG: hypothetical protein AVDCRST_MAG02-3913 [uncultured Rubrobacteraceae bacterium]
MVGRKKAWPGAGRRHSPVLRTGDSFASMSHLIRMPLNGVIGVTELAPRQPSGPKTPFGPDTEKTT